MTDLHLRFLELWTRDLPETKVLGVDLLVCVNYELVQYLNRICLADHQVKPEGQEGAAA